MEGSPPESARRFFLCQSARDAYRFLEAAPLPPGLASLRVVPVVVVILVLRVAQPPLLAEALQQGLEPVVTEPAQEPAVGVPGSQRAHCGDVAAWTASIARVLDANLTVNGTNPPTELLRDWTILSIVDRIRVHRDFKQGVAYAAIDAGFPERRASIPHGAGLVRDKGRVMGQFHAESRIQTGVFCATGKPGGVEDSRRY